MIPFTIKTKKKQAINLCQKYFNLYNPFYYNNKQKGNKQKNIITPYIPELKIINIKFFLSKHIIMVKLTTYEVKLIAKNRVLKTTKLCQEKSY